MKTIRKGLAVGVVVIGLIASERPAESRWWHRTASKAGEIEGVEYLQIGGKQVAVVVRGKDKPIECPEGFWQSNSRGVPFCVNKSHSTYKDTPICLISLGCKQLKLSDYRIPLWLNSEPLARNWQHYANAVNVGKVEGQESLTLGEAWPGTKGVWRSWGEVASLLCEGLSCQRLALGNPRPSQLIAALNLAGLGMSESWPTLGEMAGSTKPVNLSHLPADWFARQSLVQMTNHLNLWEQSLEQLGISQPTTGQLGLTYGQFHIVQASGGASGLNGRTQFFYDNRRPSDNVNLKTSGQEEIITGSNRFIKNQCTVKGQTGVAYNNCANIVVRQNATVSPQGEYQRFVLVTAHQEKLQGLGGGDVIIQNTAINDLTPHPGDFRGPEIIGGTNDEPILPPGDGKEIGIKLDQCNPAAPVMAPLIHTNTLVPAYPNPSALCPNIFRKPNVEYQKQIFLFSQNGHDHLEAFIPRVCSPRQLYRLTSDGRRTVAVKDIVVAACNSVPEATQVQGNRLTGQNVIHVFIRGGLLAKPE